MSRLHLCAFLVLIGIFVSGCGGGSGSSSSSGGGGNPDQPDITDPVDPPIESGVGYLRGYKGIFYITDSRRGYTGDDGRFFYEEGDTISFSLDEIEFGKTVTTTSEVTLYDLFETDAAVNNAEKFLEAIDHDANPGNGIDINFYVGDAGDFEIDFNVTERQFILAYADYAESMASWSNLATGDIGQTDDMFNITLSKGVATFIPSPSSSTQSSDTSVAVIRNIKISPTSDYNRYIIGLTPGNADIRFVRKGVETIYHVTVVDPDDYTEFTGLQSNKPGSDEIGCLESVSYLDFLDTIAEVESDDIAYESIIIAADEEIYCDTDN